MQYEPLGVVGVISPWNFPMNVMCRKTLPALLTGNTVVFKPATFTPWSGVFMAQTVRARGSAGRRLQLRHRSGIVDRQRIVEDPRVRAITFTGSTEVGKKIQAKAAANLTRTQLELGGKNALIVMDDADIDEAVDAAVTAGFSNAGQWCTSTSRVLLHRAIAKPFLETLDRALREDDRRRWTARNDRHGSGCRSAAVSTTSRRRSARRRADGGAR